MYFIVVKFQTKPEWTDRWLDLVADFTEATRSEPGDLWFEWSRSVDNPAEFVLGRGVHRRGCRASCQQRSLQAGGRGHEAGSRPDPRHRQPPGRW